MGLGVSGKVPELSFEESAGFFLPGNIVGGGSWKILVGAGALRVRGGGPKWEHRALLGGGSEGP